MCVKRKLLGLAVSRIISYVVATVMAHECTGCGIIASMKFKPTTSRMIRTGSAGIMAKNFLKNLDAGLMIDRTKPSKRKCAKKRMAAPAALMKFAKRPCPLATESVKGLSG